ncbi:conserved hypothetical protein [Neisseria gonorrhoeae DGI2]|uniref:Uncharacterized protein n=1 Tax=Neisseria gonorrhoeae (strain NCCP11945) TaxID=521006 RepID=B4RP33_NEIG2|nr:Hypothetical protein NGK_1693 [Neisseria gonorrhoeae NCCP11945]EFE04848.1 conserved hypothetical protein [Neisseria gonorrhoeae DGI2]
MYPTAPFSRNVGFKNPTHAADNALIGRLKNDKSGIHNHPTLFRRPLSL